MVAPVEIDGSRWCGILDSVIPMELGNIDVAGATEFRSRVSGPDRGRRTLNHHRDQERP